MEFHMRKNSLDPSIIVEQDYFSLKIIYIGVLFFGVLLTSLVPIAIVFIVLYRIDKKISRDLFDMEYESKSVMRRKQNKLMQITVKWTDRINAFAAGILIAAGLLHIYPEAEELFKDGLLMVGKDPHLFPFTSLFSLIGFFMLILVDVAIEYFLIHKNNSLALDDDDIFQGQTTSLELTSSQIPRPQVHSINLPIFQIIMLVICMSLHSVLEGITLGLLTNMKKMMTIFFAILTHTLIIAFSIGMQMTEMITSLTIDQSRMLHYPTKEIFFQIFSLIIFAASLPIGIITGMNLANKPKTGQMNLTLGAIQGLCCGTFLFVVFSEILPKTIYSHGLAMKEKLLRVLLFLCGIITIILMSVIIGH